VLLLAVGVLAQVLSANNTKVSGSCALTEAEMAGIRGAQEQPCVCANPAVANGPCEQPDECDQCKEANGSTPSNCSSPQKVFTNEGRAICTTGGDMKTPQSWPADPEAYDFIDCWYSKRCVTPIAAMNRRCDGSGNCDTVAPGWQCTKCSFDPMDDGVRHTELNCTCLPCPYGS